MLRECQHLVPFIHLLPEDLLGVEVPEKTEYIRLIAVELQRIASHLMWMGAYGPDTGNLSVMVWCLREREMMMDLLQELGGSRMHYNFLG